MRLDCDRGTITYITRHGERTENIECSRDMMLYPAIDSDENGHYQIERVGRAKGSLGKGSGRGGGDGGSGGYDDDYEGELEETGGLAAGYRDASEAFVEASRLGVFVANVGLRVGPRRRPICPTKTAERQRSRQRRRRRETS